MLAQPAGGSDTGAEGGREDCQLHGKVCVENDRCQHLGTCISPLCCEGPVCLSWRLQRACRLSEGLEDVFCCSGSMPTSSS